MYTIARRAAWGARPGRSPPLQPTTRERNLLVSNGGTLPGSDQLGRGVIAVDVVTLPLVPPETQIGAALRILREQRRSGLVTRDRDGSNYRLLYAGDLLRARAAHTPTVGDVPDARPVLVLNARLAQSFALDLVRPMATGLSYERMLGERGFTYALAGESDDAVMIVTLREDLAYALRGTGGYECDGQPTHYFPQPRVNLRDPCPRYPECSRPDGAMPTIRLA